MFLPGGPSSLAEGRREKNKALKRVEGWCETLLPPGPVREDCVVSVQETQCGDPNCSPIDTLIALLFQSGQKGIFGIPLDPKDVTLAQVVEHFPPPSILEKWHRGEDAEWPPDDWDEDDDDDYFQDNNLNNQQPLRFPIGTFVLCRTGPTDWLPGQVEQHWYHEPAWPPTTFVPYKIRLQDGRAMFAPADVDEVIALDTSKYAYFQSTFDNMFSQEK